jgi:hypothetical protein
VDALGVLALASQHRIRVLLGASSAAANRQSREPSGGILNARAYCSIAFRARTLPLQRSAGMESALDANLHV